MLNRSSRIHRSLTLLTLVVATATASASRAAIISAANISPVPVGLVGSGNGTLDFILFTESNGGAGNSSGAFNGDNADTDLPTGSGHTTADESFVTSIGELRDFFLLNFPNGTGGSTVHEITLMVDVNQIGGPQTISLDSLDIVRNFTAFSPPSDPRNDPLNNDITSAQQNATNASYSGGTVLAQLDGASKTLGQVAVGAGHADQAIFTGIDPFDPSFSNSDRILFHWASSDHDDGGETVFLSGSIAPQDVAMPEPASLASLFIAIGTVLARRPRRS